MAFYIRKSVRVGPLRFNLSKSGIGVSAGIPGLRVGSGPRGTYVHMGRGGLYYRRTLSDRDATADSRAQPRIETSPQTEVTHGPMESIESGCVTQMIDSSSEALLREIYSKTKRLSLSPIIACVALFLCLGLALNQVTLWLTLPTVVLSVLATIVAYQYDKLKKTVVLMYDMDDDVIAAFKELHSTVNLLRQCGAVWHVTSQGKVHDAKYHAGASHLINRKTVSIAFKDPYCVTTNLSIPCVPFGSKSFYFLPDRILVYDGNAVGAVDYNDLKTSGIEDGAVPRDAEVVDHTWKYVNKKGGPDKRFKDNRQIPICEYHELHLSSSSGVRALLQISREGVAEQIVTAIETAARTVATAETAQEVRAEGEATSARGIAGDVEDRGDMSRTTTPENDLAPDEVFASLFDILCCVMACDGRVSVAEKQTIAQIMQKVGATWSSDFVETRIESYLNRVRELGYQQVLSQSMHQLSHFYVPKRKRVLLKCLDMMALADGRIADREENLCGRIRDQLRLAPSVGD